MKNLSRPWRLLGDYRRAARNYGASLSSVLRRGARLVLRQGFRFREALAEGLLDPASPPGALDAAIGKEGLIALQKRVNAPERECVTEDKALFYPYCKGLGLPAPELYAVFGRRAGHTSAGRPLVGRDAWVDFLTNELPEECVLKPAFGYYGLGVQVLSRAAGGFSDHQGRRIDPAALYDELASQAKFRKFVFQERLSSHPELCRLSGTQAVQTIRIVTDVDGDRIECNHAFLRIITGNNVVDNYHYGKTGNLGAFVDLRDGSLFAAFGPGREGFGGTRITHHPGTGLPLIGFRIPFWKEAKSLVERAAVLFSPIRSIGWDVATTPSGPALIEANMWWGPHNVSGDIAPPEYIDSLASLLRRLRAAARRGRADWKG
jgi:hypothetical protein